MGKTGHAMTHADVMTNRYRGALLGTAIGDALGAPVEGHPTVPGDYLDSLDAGPPMTYTDDGAMTLGVGRSLVECGAFDGDHMARSLADMYTAEPWRGYGAGPPHVFRNLRKGAPWDEAAASMFGGQGSFGNGAAMRVAPVALFAHPDTDRVAHLAHRSALITHTHPEGIDGAVAQAVAVDRLLTGEEIGPERLIETLIRYMKTDAFKEQLSRIPSALDGNGEPGVRLGNGIAARRSVPTAIAVFLSHSCSYRAAVRTAIGQGGDTDTIAAMTGALAGAFLGMEAIPSVWLAVEGARDFLTLAEQLYDLARS